MNISKESIDALNAVLTIEFEKADYEPKVEKAVKDYAKRVAIKGFRPGHAPIGMVKKMYGKSLLAEELNTLVGNTLSQYIKDNNIDILGEPLPNKDQDPIDFDGEIDKVVFKFDLGISPDVNVVLGQDIKVSTYSITVGEKDVDDYINSIAMRFGGPKDVEVATENSILNGSVVVGDVANEKCFITVSNISDNDQKALFLGKKVGDEVTFDLRKAFADEKVLAEVVGVSQEDVAAITDGTTASFSVKIVSEFAAAIVDKELFDKVFPSDNIADEAAFRAKVKETIASTNAFSEDYRFHVDARKALMDKAGSLTLPEEFLKRWLTVVNRDNDKFSSEVLEKEFPTFVEDLKWQVVKNRIAKDNEVKIDYSDLLNFAKKSARAQFMQYGMNLPEDRLAEYAANMVKDEQQRNHISEGAVEDKLFALVREKVSVTNKEIDHEGFNKLFEAEK